MTRPKVACSSMFHRFSTWWRALSVVLLSLATVTWPSAAQATTTPSFTVTHQDATAALSAKGRSRVTITIELAGPISNAVARISLYPRIVTRSQITPIISGAGSPAAAMTSTGAIALNCSARAQKTFTVDIFTTHPAKPSRQCGAATPRLHLACVGAQCDGVYPLRYQVTSGETTTTKWSLLAVQASHVARPVRLDWIEEMGPSVLRRSVRTDAVLKVLAQNPEVPLTIGADYRTLSAAQQPDMRAGTALLSALKQAVASPLHDVVASPPSNIDFAGLKASGLAAQVSQQLALSNQLVQTNTGRSLGRSVVLSGTPSIPSLRALKAAGVSDVVISESAMSVAPSTTLDWGAPFHLEGAPSSDALSVDGPLSQTATDSAIEPGRRAAITLNTLAFLHFEAPNAPSSRGVIMLTSMAATPANFVRDFLQGLQGDPFVTTSSLAPLFDASLIGTNAAPTNRTLLPAPFSPWSSANINSLSSLASRVTSFNQAVASNSVSDALSVDLALSEIVGNPDSRQAAIDQATSALNAQLDQFSVSSAPITLAGPGTALPITILSTANYTVTAVVHLITDRLSFPKGHNIVTTLDSSTKSLRFPTADHRGSSLTLQVVVTTPNNQVVLARAAIQVRIAGTSVVGYLLSLGSIAVLAWWWWRTHRRRTKGRHAR
jgi:hypothetical protein